tara:strand:- start:711 stop:989 length:279 start_codon:yes stop_codon:yes gene_type:complete
MAGDFIIDSGIAVPEDYHVSVRKYPFEEMDIGDSFFVGPTYEEETQKKIGNRVAQARQTYQKRCVRQGDEVLFTQRMWKDADILGIRVWRVK